MARIQVLELPSQSLGSATATPFVLVIDQLEREFASEGFAVFSTQCEDAAKRAGARTAIVYEGTLDVVS